MENLLIIFKYYTSIISQLPLFLIELITIFGIIINISIYLFSNKNYKIKDISNTLTSIILSLNLFLLLSFFIKNKLTNTDLQLVFFNGTLICNNENILLKFFIYLFLTLFIFITYRINTKAKFATTLMNSSLLFLALCSSFLIQVENALLIFIFLDLCVFSIYKYASNSRLKETALYSIDFVTISSFASLLFYGFFFLLFIARGPMQIGIIQLCCISAILLKVGLFPICNYLICKNTKNNISFSILLYTLLPFLGVIAFIKFCQNIGFSYETCYVAISIFLMLTIFTASFNAYKAKNLIKYLANIAICYYSTYILSVLNTHEIKNAILCSLFILFILFAQYSLLCIAKINLKIDKINTNTLKGIFVKNKTYAILFSVCLLTVINVIPSILFFENIKILKGIYEFDKYGSYVIITILFSQMIIITNALKIVKNLYSKNENKLKPVIFTKRTTLNYVVPILIIVFLIISLFL